MMVMMNTNKDRLIPSSQEAISTMYLFGSFKSSERRKLLKVSQENESMFISGLEIFLDKWANADWIEEYNVERVGLWISKHCSDAVISKAKNLINIKKPSNDLDESTIINKTYVAFEYGIHSIN